MKIRQIVLVMLFMLVSVGVSAEESNFLVAGSGKVTSVTIYAKEAKVVKEINLAPSLIAEGLNNIVIEDVSSSLDLSSLQVAASGSLAAAVEEVKVEEYQKSAPVKIDEQINQTGAEIVKIERDLAKINTEINIFSNISFSLNDDITASVLKTQLDTVAKALSDILARKDNLLLLLAQKNEIKENLLQERELFVSQNKRFKLFVDVMVEKVGDENAALLIIYNEKNAGFDMSYDVRILPESEEIEIISYVDIWQKSYESWKDIELSIASSLEKSVWFGSLSDNVSLVNTGDSVKYTVNSMVYPASFLYSVDLSQDASVYFVADFINTGDMPYLKGKASMFYGGTYKGIIAVPEIATQTKSRIKIEKAEKVLVSKKTFKDDILVEGILSVENKLVKAGEIFFKSLAAAGKYKTLEITDSIDSDNYLTGDISLRDVTIAPVSFNTLEGDIVWRVNLSTEPSLIKYKAVSEIYIENE